MREKFKEWLRWVWRILKWVGHVWSILSVFGWVPVVIAVASGVLAFVQSLPPLLIFFSVVGCYTLVVTALNQREAYQQRRQQHYLITPRRKVERIKHDGVLWEYTGRHSTFSGSLIAEGPLCPKDYCLLSIRWHDYGGVHEEVRADNRDERIISESHNDAILFCQECKEQYTLGEQGKTIKQSCWEAEALFEAKHRREIDAEEN